MDEVSIIRKKRILTKCFLFVLLVNVFLQLDFVEDYFNSESSYTVTQDSTKCGSQNSLECPDSENKSLSIASLSISALFNGTKSKSALLKSDNDLHYIGGIPLFLITVQPAFLQIFPKQSSGLSPPLS